MKTNKFLAQCIILITLLFFISCDSNQAKTARYTQGTYTITEKDGNLTSDKDWVKFICKDEDKDFVILNLTDIQLGTSAYLKDFGEISKMIDRVIKKADPDLITITGDISYGCSTAFYGICSFINSYNIPWAPVYGNHDFGNSGMTAKTQAQVLEHYSNCLFASGPEALAFDSASNEEAYGNYVVNIVEKGKVIKSLIFMNSMQAGISPLQMDWYEDCVESTDATSAVFMHIPVHGFTEANNKAFKHWNVSVAQSYTTDTSFVWNEGYEDSFGVAYWANGPSADEGFADLMENLNSTDLIVAGHQHENCSCIKYNGITYLYSLKTGSGYSYREDMCGGTEISIKNDGTFSVRHIFEPI